MIFYLNKGLILEQEIVKALQDYFNTVGVPEYYGQVTVYVTNRHPFARLLINSMNGGAAPDMSVFPAIVVATEDDSKTPDFTDLVEVEGFALTPEDVEPGQDEDGHETASALERRGYMMMTPEKLEAIREAVNEQEKVYGISTTIRRRDRVSIEIWAENVQLKNELYEIVRLFVAGWMKEYLGKLYEENALAIFDSTVRGQRSNNFNVDFGVELHGALITFEADYAIEQSVIDTDLHDTNIDVMEVINHVVCFNPRANSPTHSFIGIGADNN